MDLSGKALLRLSGNLQIKPFDCGDADLNDFLFNDSKNYLNKLLAVTYLLESEDRTLGFFSMLNDRISVEQVQSNSFWNRIFKKKMPYGKRFKSYPAVKLGRLGIDKSVQGLGFGGLILDYIKAYFVDENRTGCLYLTVDAYKQSLEFYEKNDFTYFTERDKDLDTRQMFYCLKI